MQLKPEIFEAPIRPGLHHSVVVAQAAGRRAGTAATKNRALVSGGCVFEKDVLVSRLYRRTHLISAFSVETLRGAGKGELLWSSGLEWTRDLEPPLAVAGGEGFRWECAYDNTGDLPFEVGGDSPDDCALLGLYRLPGGGEDDSPERCTR